MKKILIFIFCISTVSFSDGYYLKGSKKSEKKSSSGYSVISNSQDNEVEFINPMDFNGTDKEKEYIIEFIRENTKKSLDLIGMDSDILKREMEQQQLNSFKELTKAKDRVVMENCIKNLKMIGNYDYSLLKASYDQETSAKNKELKW